MKYKCPYCNGEVTPDDIMFGTCPHCKKAIDGTTVKEEYETRYASSNNKENSIKRNGYERTDAGKVYEVENVQKHNYGFAVGIILIFILGVMIKACTGNHASYTSKPSVPAYVETEAYKKGFTWGVTAGEKDRNSGNTLFAPSSPDPLTGVGTAEQYLAEKAGYTSGTPEYGNFLRGYEDGYYYGYR